MYLYDERFGGVVVSSYTGSEGYSLSGVYETVNDNWLIVSTNTFENLLYKRKTCLMSKEEVKEQVRQEIIEEYLEEQRQAKLHRESNLAPVNKKRKKEGEIRKNKIIAMVLEGYIKDEIMSCEGYSKSTVNKALQGIDELEMLEMYHQNKNKIYRNVPTENLNAFIKAGCNYKAFRRWLADKG